MIDEGLHEESLGDPKDKLVLLVDDDLDMLDLLEKVIQKEGFRTERAVDGNEAVRLARARARNVAEPHCETRMDDQSIEFHRQVYQAYHALAAREPGRVKLVDGRADVDTIERQVWSIVGAYV